MGNPSKETKLTAAERCKRYREKHRDRYRAADNLRKKVKRAMTKLNPELEKKRLKKQADAKKLQRMRKKSSSNEAKRGAHRSAITRHRVMNEPSDEINAPLQSKKLAGTKD